MDGSRSYRIGIDVGGTFTKAVLIDNAGFEVVGRYCVLTTRGDARGVAPRRGGEQRLRRG